MTRFALFTLLVLGACTDPGPTGAVSSAPTAKAAMADVFVKVSVANFVAGNCRDQGIRAAYRNVSQAIDVGQRQLQMAGYDAAELAQARVLEVKSSAEARARLALDYLLDRGAKPGDIAALCAVGLKEMENRSFVGTLLRKA